MLAPFLLRHPVQLLLLLQSLCVVQVTQSQTHLLCVHVTTMLCWLLLMVSTGERSHVWRPVVPSTAQCSTLTNNCSLTLRQPTLHLLLILLLLLLILLLILILLLVMLLMLMLWALAPLMWVTEHSTNYMNYVINNVILFNIIDSLAHQIELMCWVACWLIMPFLGRLRSVHLIIWVRCPSVCPSVRPSTKSFSDSDVIWYRYVGRGRWVMHDGMPYDPIQDQGHETFKVRNSSIFKIYLLRHF